MGGWVMHKIRPLLELYRQPPACRSSGRPHHHQRRALVGVAGRIGPKGSQQQPFIAALTGGEHLDPAEVVDINHRHRHPEGGGEFAAGLFGLAGAQHDRLVVGGAWCP